MTEANRNTIEQKYAMLLAAICLLVGIVGGWFLHIPQAPAVPVDMTAVASTQATSQAPSPARMKAMADAQAAPQVEQLKADPNNTTLLTGIGNLYYDAQQYQSAIDYYQRTLKVKPADAAVRTDMATAYWYLGNADTALSEFDKALTYQPNNPNTLFNRGMVRWQGKMDSAGALADWQKLLATDPSYDARDKVLQMMAEVKQHASVKPATPAK
jgi:tetratricopeptide (TPR) repeat protein